MIRNKSHIISIGVSAALVLSMVLISASCTDKNGTDGNTKITSSVSVQTDAAAGSELAENSADTENGTDGELPDAEVNATANIGSDAADPAEDGYAEKSDVAVIGSEEDPEDSVPPEDTNITAVDNGGKNDNIPDTEKSDSEVPKSTEAPEKTNKTDGTTAVNVTAAETDPLIQVLPNGDILLPDDEWE